MVFKMQSFIILFTYNVCQNLIHTN